MTGQLLDPEDPRVLQRNAAATAFIGTWSARPPSSAYYSLILGNFRRLGWLLQFAMHVLSVATLVVLPRELRRFLAPYTLVAMAGWR